MARKSRYLPESHPPAPAEVVVRDAGVAASTVARGVSDLDDVVRRLLDVPIPERLGFLSAVLTRMRLGRHRNVASSAAELVGQVKNILVHAVDTETARRALERLPLEDEARRAFLRAEIAEQKKRQRLSEED